MKNFTTEIWKEQAFQKIFYYMDETNKNEKQKLIETNYNWAKTLSWEKQTKNLIDNYIYPNDVIEYKGMYNWTNDLPSGEKNIFLNMISYFNNNYNKVKFSKPINILEVGVYTGVSLIEIVDCVSCSGCLVFVHRLIDGVCHAAEESNDNISGYEGL